MQCLGTSLVSQGPTKMSLPVTPGNYNKAQSQNRDPLGRGKLQPGPQALDTKHPPRSHTPGPQPTCPKRALRSVGQSRVPSSRHFSGKGWGHSRRVLVWKDRFHRVQPVHEELDFCLEMRKRDNEKASAIGVGVGWVNLRGARNGKRVGQAMAAMGCF